MSEKSPTSSNESEPHGADIDENPAPEPEATDLNDPDNADLNDPDGIDEADSSVTAEAATSTADQGESAPADFTNAPLATEPGQFRTTPLNLEPPFIGGPLSYEGQPQPPSQYQGQPQSQAQSNIEHHRNLPTQQYTRVYPQAQPYPQGGQVPQNRPVPPNQQVPQNRPASPNQQTHHVSGQPAGTPLGQTGSAPAGPRTYPANPIQQPSPQQPSFPQQLPPQHPNQQGFNQPHPNQPRPNPGMPPATGRPPRRKKPKPDNAAYAPVTGRMPLTDRHVTEIPPEGPIEWPRTKPGIVGVGNLFLSAVMAVIWAWIPIGLLVTGIGGIFALGLGVLALGIWVVVQQGANVFERYRAELIYADGIPVPNVERSSREPGFGRFVHNRWLQLKSGSFWRSTAHHFVKMLFGATIVLGTTIGFCLGILSIFGAINPDGVSTAFVSEYTNGFGRVGVAIGALIVIASSLAILWFSPYLDRALDRSLLPPARTAALQAEVTELDRARMAGIEAAAAERQRIERDLHDGAQPRLVALSMTLGMAKSKINTDPERATELISEAHSETKGIINELRQLARGIHPAVLTDRGLDAAVSALAGRSPIPVEVDVRLSGRIDREAEAVSYFVVAECLTNVAKHAGASWAKVVVKPTEIGVEIIVTDNGRGGARIDRSGTHTGLAGLVDRVEAARGTLNLTSPAGGPTTVVVEVPCAS